MSIIVHQQWRDNNSHVNYPFSDVADLKLESGNVLSTEFIIDARIHLIGGVAPFYIDNITITQTKVIITIFDINNKKCTAEFTINDANFEKLALVDIYNRPAGVLVTNSTVLSEVVALGIGVHEFEDSAAAEFVATVCIPVPENGVMGFINDAGELISNAVHFIGKDGIVLSNDNGEIRIDIVGDPLFKRSNCQALGLTEYDDFRVVQTIDNISPNTVGNFSIISGNNLTANTNFRVINTDKGIIYIGLIGS